MHKLVWFSYEKDLSTKSFDLWALIPNPDDRYQIKQWNTTTNQKQSQHQQINRFIKASLKLK
jgi:hypothetical protein